MDPSRYPDQANFDPSHFIGHSLSASAYANSPDTAARDHFSYGGGKRICVGLHLAERSLFTMTSWLLHAFEILPALDERGVNVPVDVNAVKTGLIMSPKEFISRFKVRGEGVGRLMEREKDERYTIVSGLV